MVEGPGPTPLSGPLLGHLNAFLHFSGSCSLAGPPGPPEAVTIDEITDTTAQLSWRPGPDNHSPVTMYVIQARTPFSVGWQAVSTGTTAGARGGRPQASGHSAWRPEQRPRASGSPCRYSRQGHTTAVFPRSRPTVLSFTESPKKSYTHFE